MIDGYDEYLNLWRRRLPWRSWLVAFCVGLVIGWVWYSYAGG